MGARSRASRRKTTSSWAASRPESSEPESGKRAPADGVFTDLTRAAIFFGIVALVVGVGEDLSVASLATPIIAVSAHDTSDFQSEAIQAGCNRYITKPIDFNELEALISELLTQK